ncbi:MAG TPA: hypothetical protein VKZ59_11220 [Acidobacteriota bacterium]|nr:hypothetical protein [Acidobacteriota bacterium]
MAYTILILAVTVYALVVLLGVFLCMAARRGDDLLEEEQRRSTRPHQERHKGVA